MLKFLKNRVSLTNWPKPDWPPPENPENGPDPREPGGKGGVNFILKLVLNLKKEAEKEGRKQAPIDIIGWLPFLPLIQEIRITIVEALQDPSVSILEEKTNFSLFEYGELLDKGVFGTPTLPKNLQILIPPTPENLPRPWNPVQPYIPIQISPIRTIKRRPPATKHEPQLPIDSKTLNGLVNLNLNWLLIKSCWSSFVQPGASDAEESFLRAISAALYFRGMKLRNGIVVAYIGIT